MLLSQTPPDVSPVERGAKVTVRRHAAPGDNVRPAVHPVAIRHAALVAGSIDTSVNDHGALPQLLIVTSAEVLLPTERLPNASVC